VGRGLRADFGKFASSLGYETNYAKDNQAFSRAFLFAFLPFYHSGLRVTMPVTNTVSLMYSLTNGVQQTEEFNQFKSNHVWANLRPAERVRWTLGYYAGAEQPDGGAAETVRRGVPRLRHLRDGRPHREARPRARPQPLHEPVTQGRPRVVARRSRRLPARATPRSDSGRLPIRTARRRGCGSAASHQRLQEVTITLEHRIADGVLGRAEYRHDWSDVAYFPSDEGLRSRQPTLLAGVVWWIGNKAGAW